MLRLPTSLLVEIFLFTIAMHWGSSRRELYARTTLRLVCQEWNTTLLRSPHCWSKIILNLENPWLLHYALRIFMHRSNPKPLYISLTAVDIPKISNAYLNRYLDLLGGAVDRWQTFSFTIGEGAPGHLLTHLEKHNFKRAVALRDFCLGIRRDDEDFLTNSILPIANIIGSIPALLHLKLEWRVLSPRAAQHLVERCRVEALKSLELRTYSSSSILILTRFALSATSLTLTIQPKYPVPLKEYPPIFAIHLRSLRYLHLTFYGDRHHLLHVLNAPFLTVLCIQKWNVPGSHNPVDPCQQLYTVLLQYLTNSHHSVRALIVSGIDLLNVIDFITHPVVAQMAVVEIIYEDLSQFEGLKKSLDGSEMPYRIRERCQVKKENNYGLDILTVGWVDPRHLRVFQETMMDPRTPHASGIFAYRALRWKYAVLGVDS